MTKGIRKSKRDIAKDVAVMAASASKHVAKELKREAGVLPKSVSDLIEKIEGKGETIEKMVVVRTPVEEYVGHLMQIVSFGKYRDAIAESCYDRMFHLSLLINGQYVLQKNEVIDLSDKASERSSITGEETKISKIIGKGLEVMAVKIPQGVDAAPLSFTLLLERTKQHMGADAFSNYSAEANNCQDFILAVLEGNGLAYPHLISFIKQDSGDIFSQLPRHTKRVANALTDMAAVGNKVAEDITIKHVGVKMGKHLSLAFANSQTGKKLSK